jgi:transposase InsO family protein
MPGQAGLLELSAGSALLLAGREWTVSSIEAQHGRVLLRADGEERWQSIRWLAHHPDCRLVPDDAAGPARPAGQPPVLDDLTDYQRDVVRLRVEHLLEAETGFRGGDPLNPAPGEPRPAYDPRTTTLGQRRRAKAAELKALGPGEAALLGLGKASERTLKRMAAAWKARGPAGCIDGRWLRARTGHRSITEEVREAIFAARAETKDRSRTSMMDKYVLVAQYVAEQFGPDVPVPGFWTLRDVWREWFGPGGTRPRYDRAADGIEAAKVHVTVHRPGQVVALDTTPLPVKVRDGVFGDPVSAHLTLALDVFTHSAVAFRLTLVSDTSVDIAMLLRDVMMPLPVRDGWGPEMEWPYPGVPASVVADFAGYRVAGLPFFAPETVTTDHGSVYKNHALIEAQRVLGCNILPARVLRPQDKAAVERAFGSLRSLLFEHLPGYTGVDVADRGADPEADAVLTVSGMERLITEWVISVWQNRALGEHAPAWGPGGEHSPNTLFAAAMNQGGFALQIPRPELYYELLPAHYVKVHAQRGVKIGGLWYGRSDPALKPYEGKLSDRGGKHKGTWVVRSDRRDRRTVFFQDPADPAEWHVLRWNGLPPEGEIPAFSDRTAEELLDEARVSGLSPRSDADLLPVLLELLGGVAPVSQWPSQMSKKEKKARAREAAQGKQAASDKAGRGPAADGPAGGGEGKVVPLRRPGQAAQVGVALDAERRRRREQAVPQRPAPPASLGDRLRSTSLLALPAEDEP